MTYKDLKAHCEAHQYCADCEYAETPACRESPVSPCYIPDGDALLDVVIPESKLVSTHAALRRVLKWLSDRAWVPKLTATLLGVVTGVALAIALCEGIKLVMPTPVAAEAQAPQSMFVEVESTNRWFVVYHRETRVMYAVGRGEYDFTLLVNPDGTPMLYNE